MASKPPDSTMASLASTTQRLLLRRIDARLSRGLASRVEAEDILQQAYISAIPHFRRQPVPDTGGFVRWMLQFATNEIRNSSRRRRGSDTSLEWETAPTRIVEADDALTRRSGTGSGKQERVLALRDRFALPWTSVSFILDRPNASSTRKLLGRARRSLCANLSEVQRLAQGGRA